jgi:hypothetical protein
MQKTIYKKIFVGILKVTDEKSGSGILNLKQRVTGTPDFVNLKVAYIRTAVRWR